MGLAVILDALFTAGQNIGQLLVGALLVGLVPVDEMLGRIVRRRMRYDDDDGLARRCNSAPGSEGGETD